MTSPSPDGPRSGLRNPIAAARGVASAALVVEALVMLLAIVPLARMAGPAARPGIWLVLILTAFAVVLAALLRYGWAWWAGLVIPVGLLVGGVFHWSLAGLGVIFGLLWGYVLNVRRSVAP
jgi:hypothetical protein